jgi:hypothetical protein
MQKQPHRAVTKTADNRYWQNQFRVDDAELEAPAEFEEYAPPSLGAAADDDRDAPDAFVDLPDGRQESET